MSEQEARDQVEQISQDYSPDQLLATFDTSKVRDGQPGGYCVKVLLKAGQRSVRINRIIEWEGIQEAWQWFLKDKSIETKLKEPKQRYLVNGVPMGIFRSQAGYWLGTYKENGQYHKRYFGKKDPRPDYPLAEMEAIR